MVFPDFLFLSVEAHALPDYRGFEARAAPDWEGHFEADGQDALFYFGGAGAEGMLVGDLIGGFDTFEFWWDVTSHICEVLIGCKWSE